MRHEIFSHSRTIDRQKMGSFSIAFDRQKMHGQDKQQFKTKEAGGRKPKQSNSDVQALSGLYNFKERSSKSNNSH